MKRISSIRIGLLIGVLVAVGCYWEDDDRSVAQTFTEPTVRGTPKLLGGSPSQSTDTDITSVGNALAWERFFVVVDDPNAARDVKARAVLSLLRATDGMGGPEAYSGKVDFISVHEGLPSTPFAGDEFFQLFLDRGTIDRHTQPISLPQPPAGRDPETAIEAWASNTGGKRACVFVERTINDFFTALFVSVQSYWRVELSHTDLFHGHLRLDDSVEPADLLVIFHAKEYPEDIEGFTRVKHELAVQNDLGASFNTTSRSYKCRNSIWSLRSGRLWRINTDASTALNHLVRSPLFDSGLVSKEAILVANTAQEDYFGNRLYDVNYFPSDYVQAFFMAGCVP